MSCSPMIEKLCKILCQTKKQKKNKPKKKTNKDTNKKNPRSIYKRMRLKVLKSILDLVELIIKENNI